MRRFALAAADTAARHPRASALAAGAVAACGFQPLALWPLTLLSMCWLVELLSRSPGPLRAFAIGWFFGLGHFTLGNNWIAMAFTYQASMPVWLGAIAVVLLALYLALFLAFAAVGAWLLARWLRDGRAMALPVGAALVPLWIVTEWVRGWLFTGFPWNPLGVALLGSYEAPGLASLLPWLGTYALSGLLVGLAAGLRWCLITAGSGGTRRTGAMIALLVGALGVTLAMTMPAPWVSRPEGTIRYTLVQPYLTQDTVDDVRHFERNFRKLAALTVPEARGERRMVFWPESGLGDYLREGLPFYLYRQMTYAADPAEARKRIGRIIGPYGLLLTGVVDLEMEGSASVAARNTVTAIDGRGSILASYSKAHLVPYGEYLPMREWLEPLGLSRLVSGTLDFWPGPGPLSFDFGRYGKVGVQICYEIVFSGAVVDADDRPDYIFNPSNDGWFGAWGPPQHLAQARLRAIEEGLPVLRSTTTGISAVIDADGVVRDFVPRGRAGRLDGTIPPPQPPTLFSHAGNWLPLGWALASFLASAVALRRRRS
jgi:apolipoprotein N-acyltransferase